MARTFGGGSTDVIAFTNYSAIDDLATISISGWSYRTGNGGGSLGRMAVKEDGGSNLGWAFFNSGSTYAFEFYRWATTDGKWTIGRPSLNQWNQYVVTYDYGSTANDPNIYWNGSLQTETETSTPAGSLNTDAAPVYVGNNSGGTRNWAGRLAEWAIWNVILDQAEATFLSQGGCPLLVRPNAIVFYAPVWGSQSPEPNYIHENSGTLTGTTASGDHPRMVYRTSKRIFMPYSAPAGGTKNYYSGGFANARRISRGFGW